MTPGALHGSVTWERDGRSVGRSVCHQSFRGFTVKGDLKVAIRSCRILMSDIYTVGKLSNGMFSSKPAADRTCNHTIRGNDEDIFDVEIKGQL